MSDQYPNQPQQPPSWAQPPQPTAAQWGGQQWAGQQWAPPQPPPGPKKRSGCIAALAVVGVVFVVFVVLVVAFVATSSDEKKNTSADNAPAATSPTTSTGATKAATPAAEPRTAHVGDTVTVHGMDDGSQLAVTLVKWVDPAKGGDAFTTPSAGKRFVAAQIRVTNTGSAVYDDTPSNGMQVADAAGQRFESTFGDVSAGPSMPAEVKLAAGDKALGYVTFEVPKGSKIVTLQFTADSGFADESGEWKIP